jgi:protein O-mannosyl-transferase
MGRRTTKKRSPDGRQEKTSRLGRIAHGAWLQLRDHAADLAVCGFLLLAIAAVFGQTVQYDFTDCDDSLYVTENPHVTGGMTAERVVWAFTQSYAANWHPLTWLSHMLDCQFYGLEHPGGHHLTNVILHAANTILLFLVLRQLIRDLGASAFVAALFAIHPLHVESVAWIAERKDVLSGLFFMLTVAAYVGYARREFSLSRYLLVTVFFVLGLMAKPMLVTLPFVLLLLDYWPLERLRATGADDARRLRRVLWEKLPWLALAAVGSVITFLAQQKDKAVLPLNLCPISWRIANSIVAYATYLVQFFWPAELAVLYPHPGTELPVWKIVTASLVLIVITIMAIAWRRKCPYLLVGWLWYLGMLVPVIGLVQVGGQAMADRYTYLTQIGLYVALALGVMQAVGSSPTGRRACSMASLLVVLVLGLIAWHQTTYWQDTGTLLNHALACTSRNLTTHRTLGAWLERHGEVDAAITQYEKALEIDVNDAAGHSHVGLLLVSRGKLNAAIPHFGRAGAINPKDAQAFYNIGLAFAGLRRFDMAIIGFQKALTAKPDFAEAHDNLGNVFFKLGQLDAAILHYRKALEIDPNYLNARKNLALVLAAREHNGATTPVREPQRSAPR